ncbi:hypothetical protein [Tuberibacillus sp. Marseille-P3662]|uniref:hypothetical protein n=1 Tax=Tuberibacillus sp. Marseille-P3662 TaxID=1965358 RepID=UPI000A1CC47F|nr:hypothetical protein [Tuberibacillus sp. Marseille-P3662]
MTEDRINKYPGIDDPYGWDSASLNGGYGSYESPYFEPHPQTSPAQFNQSGPNNGTGYPGMVSPYGGASPYGGDPYSPYGYPQPQPYPPAPNYGGGNNVAWVILFIVVIVGGAYYLWRSGYLQGPV